MLSVLLVVEKKEAVNREGNLSSRVAGKPLADKPAGGLVDGRGTPTVVSRLVFSRGRKQGGCGEADFFVPYSGQEPVANVL